MYLKCSAVIVLIFIQCLFVYSSKLEGSACEMKDGTMGICQRLIECGTGLKEFHKSNFPNFCTLDVWKPLVCCLDCRDIQQTNGAQFLVSGYGNASDACLEGYYNQVPCHKLGGIYKELDPNATCYSNPQQQAPVIAGGEDAMRREYPHMALIGYGDDPDRAEWMCGGSVISVRHILTAAHCISSTTLGPIRYAALGILNRSDNQAFWQIYDIVKIISHPGYRPPSKYHDIALLVTGAKIRYNLDVYPACLERGINMPLVAIATGWGTLGHRKPLAETLQFVQVKKYSDFRCSQEYPTHRHLKYGYDRRTQVCYGDRNRIRDTCEGDSGGPIQVYTHGLRKRKCIYTIVGVTSYGKACGYLGSSGMYTRVAPYIPWIESYTGRLM